MDGAGSNDLFRLFADLSANATWNSAPTTAIVPLARLEQFYKEMIKLCKNGMLPRRRLALALEQVDADQSTAHPYRWNFASRSTNDAAEQLGATMRIGASKLRDLNMDAKLYTTAMMGALSTCVASINRLLDRMVIEHTGE